MGRILVHINIPTRTITVHLEKSKICGHLFQNSERNVLDNGFGGIIIIKQDNENSYWLLVPQEYIEERNGEIMFNEKLKKLIEEEFNKELEEFEIRPCGHCSK